DHYDRVTEAWHYIMGDDLHVGYFTEANQDLFTATQALTRLMAEYARIERGGRVLDVGCGTGNPAIHLALHYECNVLGISNSQAGIERAKSRAAEKNAAHNIDFRLADATATGCTASSFDYVWAMESPHLISPKELLIQEFARILRPGGTAVLCDLMLMRPYPAQPGAALWRDLVVLEKAYGKANLQSQQTYIQQFEAFGLKSGGQDISQNVLPTFALWGKNAKDHARQIGELLGQDQLNYFIKSCNIMTRLFEDGQLGYCLVRATKPL